MWFWWTYRCQNGYEATDEIRQFQDAKDIPIIAITAGIMVGDKEKCFEAGMDDYFKTDNSIWSRKILYKWLQKSNTIYWKYKTLACK
jgi:CheY-like chemotaxis protein